MYGVHISFLLALLSLPLARCFIFYLTHPVTGSFSRRISDARRAELREYVVFEYEHRRLIFYEVINDYINHEILKPGLPLYTIVFFRAIPWIFLNMFVGLAAQPYLLFILKFILLIPYYAEVLVCGGAC